MFAIAGLVFLIGADTTILVVGFIIIPIAFNLMAVAFLSINENAQVSLQPNPV